MTTAVEIIGAEDLERALEALVLDAERNEAFLDKVATRAFYPMVQATFDTEGGGRWPGLTPRYERQKLNRFGDMPLMQATTDLMTSLTQKGSAFNVHEHVSPGEVVIGSSLPYAGAATDIRPVDQVTPEGEENMGKAASSYLVGKATDLGFEANEE
jgi:hypothetical protein